MIISIGNVKHGAIGEFVGRGSILGNPFKIGPDGDRTEVIQKYRNWLFSKMSDGDHQVLSELERLLNIARSETGLILVCYCYPLHCHAEMIMEALEILDSVTPRL